ncbi:FecR family protein [Flavitalea flava]
MRKEDFIRIIDKYLSGTATPEERLLLEEYYSHLSSQEKKLPQQEDLNKIKEELLERIIPSVQPLHQDRSPEIPLIRIAGRRLRWIAAASLLVVVCITGYLKLHVRAEVPADLALQSPSPLKDISPGTNKAVLTLANGEQIVLDTAKGGAITKQGDIRIIKHEGGLLTYKGGDSREGTEASASTTAITYNTLTTPRGGQYKVTLSDGTRVWLNAASSLHYPTAFAGRERSVDVTGEAYFEVEKNPTMPFIVRVNGAEVRVLGTQFNIMAYGEEGEVNTTLVEGGVKISKGNNSETLKPGQQARFTPGGVLTLVDDVDVEDIIAWKNNLFSFNDADIQTVMRQIARWYNIEVKYEGKVTQHFNGNISRTVNVSKVFSMLELTGSVHFKIGDKQVMVNP